MGGGGRGYEHNYEAPPPISGQKRGFPFPGRGGASPDHSDGAKFAKLFIGSVPCSATEEDIRPLFEEHGNVVEVAFIKDKRTGQQRGCCFIKYSTSEEANRAIRALHNQYTLPGALGPIQVRYADGERERLGAAEYKLFVGSLNKQAIEQEVEAIFAPYGRVEDVYLMRDAMRQSRGCGFVKYANRDMALAAINGLNGIYIMRGCDQPLTVRFAEPKRPRPGDSRGGPPFGGPGFGPRFQSPGAGPPPFFNESSGDGAPPSAWKPMSMLDQGPPSHVDDRSYVNMLPRSSDMSAPLNPIAPVPAVGGHTDGRPGPMVPSSLPQQGFSPPFQQFPPISQQISTLQNPLQSPPQQLHPSLKLHSQPAPSYSQAQTYLPQVGPKALPDQTQVGLGQQSTASSMTALQVPPSINMQSQGRPSLPNQPHQVFPQLQQFPQLPLQSPSPMAQMLTQQAQALQASFQSSQQAFSQIQQQLQMMQPPNQSVTPLQQSSQPPSQQWPKDVMQTPTSSSVATTAVEAPSSSSAAATPVPVKCSWTEHTSPDGFKYYYSSVTGESRWIEPEELKRYKQQQQQQLQLQKPPVQQSQLLTQQYPQVLSTQPQQLQLQAQPQMQFPQQPLQQHLMPSSYQSSGASGPQNVQELGYPQYQVAPQPSNDPARFQQGLQAPQEWMWKNKPPTGHLTKPSS